MEDVEDRENLFAIQSLACNRCLIMRWIWMDLSSNVAIRPGYLLEKLDNACEPTKQERRMRDIGLPQYRLSNFLSLSLILYSWSQVLPSSSLRNVLEEERTLSFTSYETPECGRCTSEKLTVHPSASRAKNRPSKSVKLLHPRQVSYTRTLLFLSLPSSLYIVSS